MSWDILVSFVPIVAQGLWVTIGLSLGGILGATVIAISLGTIYEHRSLIVRRPVRAYVEVMRNLPILVKVFFLYFAVGLDALPAALSALILHQSGFMTEIVASGIRAVPREQGEAAYSCGFTAVETQRYVILPQAIRHTIPPLTSQYVEVIKNSSVVMLIGVHDLTFATQQIQYETFRYTEGFIVVTTLYVLIALSVIGAMNLLQGKLKAR